MQIHVLAATVAAAALVSSACLSEADVGPEHEAVPELGSTEHALSREQPTTPRTWPAVTVNGTTFREIEVCFVETPPTGFSMAGFEPDYVAYRERFKKYLLTSWGRVANIRFWGFGVCPANWHTTPRMGIHSRMSLTGTATGGQALSQVDTCYDLNLVGRYNCSSLPASLGIATFGWRPVGVNDPAEEQYLVLHEVGHLLGFDHEQDRLDNPDPNSPVCGRNVQAPAYVHYTVYDPASVMNYCNAGQWENPEGRKLSFHDVEGARWIYRTRRPTDPTPAAVSPAYGESVVAWVDPQGRILSKFFHAGAWSSNVHVAAAYTVDPDSQLSMVSASPGWAHLFWVNRVGDIVLAGHLGGPSSYWVGPVTLATGEAQPGVRIGVTTVRNKPGAIVLFWTKGTTVRSMHYVETSPGQGYWSSPYSVSGVNAASPWSPVSGISTRNDETSAFWTGIDGSVRNTFFSAASGTWAPVWSVAGPHETIPGNGLGAVSETVGSSGVYWSDNAGRIRGRRFDAAWNAWGSVLTLDNVDLGNGYGAIVGTTPTAVSPANGVTWVAWPRENGQVAASQFSWGAPSTSTVTVAGRAQAGGSLALSSTASGAATAFWVNGFGAVVSTYRTTSTSWVADFALTSPGVAATIP